MQLMLYLSKFLYYPCYYQYYIIALGNRKLSWFSVHGSFCQSQKPMMSSQSNGKMAQHSELSTAKDCRIKMLGTQRKLENKFVMSSITDLYALNIISII